MGAPAVVKIDIVTDTKQASAGLKDASEKTKGFGSTFKSTFGGVLSGGLVTAAASKIWAFGQQSIKAYEGAQANSVKYADAMKRIPGASDAATASMVAQAKALAKVTTFSAGATKQGQAVLAGFHLTAAQIKQLTPLLQDYATKTGKDLPTAAQDMGKAILGQGRAFKAIGLNLKDTKTQAGNFGQLVTGLSGKVGGLAVQMGDSAAGKAAIMENSINALKTTMGQKLLPIMEQVVSTGLKLTSWITANISWLIPLVGALLAVVGAMKILNVVMAVTDALMAANPFELVIVGLVILGAALVLAYNKVGWFRDAVQLMGRVAVAAFEFIKSAAVAVFNWIKANWPLLLAILTGPIGVAVLLITRHWSTITSVFRSAASTIGSIVSSIGNFFSSLPGRIAGAIGSIARVIVAPFIAGFEAVKGVIQDAWNWIKSKIDSIKGIVSAGISLAKSVYNPFANAWNAVHVSFTVPKGIPGIGGKGIDFGLPTLPTLASGGVFGAATLAIIGEGRGREIASPEALLRSIVRQEAGGATINVYVPATANPAETGRAVANVLRSYFAAGGRLTVPA